ncbi:hypothetical protein [Neobacillus sp. 19]|uniref:hypothetical protein n=1 Tax=Neobacillus sp. 19 TaxID=3394458 RepID=UPI003BF6499C
MNIRQRIKELDNIWYHYKTHILIGILIIAALVPLAFFDKHEKPTALNVTFVGNTIEDKQQQALQKKANFQMLKPDSKSEIKLNFWRINGNLTTTQDNMDLYQKLLTQIAAKDIDILVLDKSDFLVLSQQGAFKDLDFINKVNHDKKSNKNAIDLTEHALLRQAGFNSDNKVMAILSNTKKEETAIKFVQWFMKQTN